mgnify:CR=1 FL=1
MWGAASREPLLIVCICCKRCQKHDTLCQRSIKAFHIQKSVQTVASKEHRSESHAVCLCQNQRSLRIVNRKEYQICICSLSLGKLYREVCFIICGKCFSRYDFEILVCCFFCKFSIDTGRIYIRAVIDNCYLRCKFMFTDVLS